MNEVVIELTDVNKSFPVGDTTVQVLKNISFQVRAGEFVAIVGQSGSGKSTLLNMLTGVDRPSSGEVMVAGQKLVGMSEDQLAIWRRTAIGIVFQFFNLVPGLTLGQNVRLPMDLAATVPANGRPERVRYLLEHVGLAERLSAIEPCFCAGTFALKRRVERHGGHVRIRTSPGGGTEIGIHMPRRSSSSGANGTEGES